MNREEFYLSTLAQVTELYRVQILTWAHTRDYFVSQVCAILVNKTRTKNSDPVQTPDGILECRYPPKKKGQSVIITPDHDPDRGAVCDWRDMRDRLKSKGRRRQ